MLGRGNTGPRDTKTGVVEGELNTPEKTVIDGQPGKSQKGKKGNREHRRWYTGGWGPNKRNCSRKKKDLEKETGSRGLGESLNQ